MSLDIEKLQELCAGVRGVLGDTAIIAGGAPRDACHGRPIKDIDVFVRMPQSREVFRQGCQNLADYLSEAHGELVCVTSQSLDEARSGGKIADLVDLVGGTYPVQIIALDRDPVDDIADYDFGLSQLFVTPRALFYTEEYLGDANGLTVTYTGTAEVGSARFNRSVKRLARLRAKYAPEFTFRNCEALDKVAADSVL